MLANIVDRRTDNYNVLCDVVYEPSCHDNTMGSTQFPTIPSAEDFGCHYIDAITFGEIPIWAAQWKYPVTAFVYDVGTNQKVYDGDGNEITEDDDDEDDDTF